MDDDEINAEIERTWPINVKNPVTDVDTAVVMASGQFLPLFNLVNGAGGNQFYYGTFDVMGANRGQVKIWVHNGIAVIVYMRFPYTYAPGGYYQTEVNFNGWNTVQIEMLAERTLVNAIQGLGA